MLLERARRRTGPLPIRCRRSPRRVTSSLNFLKRMRDCARVKRARAQAPEDQRPRDIRRSLPELARKGTPSLCAPLCWSLPPLGTSGWPGVGSRLFVGDSLLAVAGINAGPRKPINREHRMGLRLRSTAPRGARRSRVLACRFRPEASPLVIYSRLRSDPPPSRQSRVAHLTHAPSDLAYEQP